MRKALMILGLGAAIVGSFPSPDKASAQALNCRIVEGIGNAIAGDIRAQLEPRVVGRFRINPRKRLRIHGIDSISFDGCRSTIQLRVTLHRKIRRDAHGYVRLSANVTSFGLRPARVCLNRAGVSEVRVSHTLGIGEAFYRMVANMALPDGGCFAA